MITLATIEQQTRDYAAVRRAALDQAAQIQGEIDAVRERHAKALRRRVQRTTEAHEALFERIAAAPALFPEGAKSIVVDSIKVGYQKGKPKLEVKDEAATIRVLQSLMDGANAAYAERLATALKTTTKLVDAGLKKLRSLCKTPFTLSLSKGSSNQIKDFDRRSPNGIGLCRTSLTSEELLEVGVALIPAADSVLVMPQEDDATKAVDALIKAAQADIADGA